MIHNDIIFHRWESKHIPNLKFVEASEHNVAYGAHLHDFLEVIWVRSGRCEMISRNQRYVMNRGEAVIISPNEVHAGGSSGQGFSFTTLQVPCHLLEQIFGFTFIQGRHPLQLAPAQLVEAPAAGRLYKQLIGTLPKLASEDAQMSCMKNALGKFFNSKNASVLTLPSPVENHPAVVRTKSIIDSDFTESIDFGRLATEVNLHQRYLISLFKTFTGIPPHQYQIALRVERGRCLIEEGRSLSSVASTAGFSDQSHFNRHFKRVYGSTPGLFRDQTARL